MEFLFENLIPLLVFIVLPIARGIKNSNKQKKEYAEQRRKVTYNPTTVPKPKPQPWGNILGELQREIRGRFQEQDPEGRNSKTLGQDKKEEGTLSLPQTISNREEETTMPRGPIKKGEDFRPRVERGADLSLEDLENKNLQPSLEFSQDAILQGIIFSEILGPPKARRK